MTFWPAWEAVLWGDDRGMPVDGDPKLSSISRAAGGAQVTVTATPPLQPASLLRGMESVGQGWDNAGTPICAYPGKKN